MLSNTFSLRHPLVSYVIPFSFYFYISTPLEAFLVLNFHLRGSILERRHLAVISYNKLIALSFPCLHSPCILQPILGSLSVTSIRVPGQHLLDPEAATLVLQLFTPFLYSSSYSSAIRQHPSTTKLFQRSLAGTR
jgi:hypothetical protein